MKHLGVAFGATKVAILRECTKPGTTWSGLRHVTKVSETVLSEHLTDLRARGFLQKDRYLLTEQGRDYLKFYDTIQLLDKFPALQAIDDLRDLPSDWRERLAHEIGCFIIRGRESGLEIGSPKRYEFNKRFGIRRVFSVRRLDLSEKAPEGPELTWARQLVNKIQVRTNMKDLSLLTFILQEAVKNLLLNYQNFQGSNVAILLSFADLPPPPREAKS